MQLGHGGTQGVNSELRKTKPAGNSALCALTAAAAILGLQTSNTHAEAAPERASISFKYLDYQDYQPDSNRIHVAAPTVALTVPVAGEWAINTSYIVDTITGASPLYHDSNLTKMSDRREAYTAGATRYLPTANFNVNAAYSTERDYISKSLSASVNFMSEDKNTIYTVGVGSSNDTIIGSSIGRKSKDTVDAVIGVTKILGVSDIVQGTYRKSMGQGYFSDQYKLLDTRPDYRNIDSVLFRWNHYLKDADATVRSSYRYYQDSFDIRSHTLGLEYVQRMRDGWTFMPLVRYYSQSSASFYFDPDSGGGAPLADITAAIAANGYASMDQRLSSFGAITYGAKLTKTFGRDWIVDLKIEKYEQRGEWALSNGSSGLSPFHARSIQIGFTHFFD
jgi:hypothetical protein